MTDLIEPTRKERMVIVMAIRGLSGKELSRLRDYWSAYYDARDSGESEEVARRVAIHHLGGGGI